VQPAGVKPCLWQFVPFRKLRYAPQLLVEQLLPFREKFRKVRVYVDGYGSARADSRPNIFWKQVALEIGIPSAALDPDITRT